MKKANKKNVVRGHWAIMLKGHLLIIAGFAVAASASDGFQLFPSNLMELLENLSVETAWNFISKLLAPILMLFGALDLAMNISWLATSKLTLLSKGVEWRTGLINQEIELIDYRRIESVSLYRSLLGRMLNYGTLRLYGVGSGSLLLPNLKNATKLCAYINKKHSVVTKRTTTENSSSVRATTEE